MTARWIRAPAAITGWNGPTTTIATSAGSLSADTKSDIQHFSPTHETRGTVAARGFLSLTDTSPGQQTPFFMQQTVGGPSNLRGFRQYRFRDKNLLFLNLEYRWEASRHIEVIGFGDAGRVFARRSQFGLNDLEGSFGVGGRIKFREAVFFGLDVGVGREGIRLWLRGSHTF